ncbi:unnamed protein product [Didymodactylos carnosus]|uniref:5-formyltetrahydrofolate cyclo-ligase n=1 Tax=Didymodactylos carnosus TaxID=1234261 RepID=A0A813VP63_9BILA|nr:unnamed protein product [Didymodactylos carnosus]CAF0841454.1 unnamed protein product [Didymodactylos carnosus]CAF3569189.1 unnamed protein product [Didymodactylos carnosus]CAF3628820.1 unnamed protein product [Didymodactylos carnosus]
MKLMFFPVTMIEEIPHMILYYDFTRKRDRYFLGPYEVTMLRAGSVRTICEIICSSDFLCGLLNVNRPEMLKELSQEIPDTDKEATENSSPSLENYTTAQRRDSCLSSKSASSAPLSPVHERLLSMIEQRLDFKHRCMFYSTDPTSDLSICALNVDYNSSILCNSIGYPNPVSYDEHKTGNNTNNSNNREDNRQRVPTKYPHKMKHQRRDYVHEWICIRDIYDEYIACDNVLKLKAVSDILVKMDLWLKQRCQPFSLKTINNDSNENIKLFKAKARQLIWDLMEMKNEVRFPRPAHGRIPHFRYSEVAADNFAKLDCFRKARVVKVNPSLAQEPLRHLTLLYNKVLLTPTPSLGSALFYKLDPKFLQRRELEWASSKTGAAELGTVVQLQALKQIHVDIVVVASVVVNPVTGARIGKGKGYGDLEYAIMNEMGAVNSKTIVVTTVHESQLINDFSLMEEHDLPVDIIVTPRRYIYTKRLFPRPTKILWDKLDHDMLLSIPVLQELKRLEEQDVAKH